MIQRTWVRCISLLSLLFSVEAFDCNSALVSGDCNEFCQYCQQQALLDYLWLLDGPRWISRGGWPANGKPDTSRPSAHCSWYGVYCCSANFTISDLANPAALSNTISNQTSCEIPNGVAIILLGNNGLKGTLSSSLFSTSALRISLEVFRAESKIPSFGCCHCTPPYWPQTASKAFRVLA